MKKSQFHEFNPVVYPIKLWVSVGEETFSPDFSIYPDGGIIVVQKDRTAITYFVYRNSDDMIGIIIHFPKKEYMTVKTIAHEARHAGDILFEYIGDDPQHSEPAAYFTGWVADCIDKARTNK